MSLINRIRRFVNDALAPVGLAVMDVKKRSPWGSRLVSAKVGNFTIQTLRISQIATIYLDTPSHMQELGILASLLKQKYPKLSAIDIGANVGDTACIIKTAADIPIICIEGDDSTFELLQRNIQQFQNVTAHKIFLGEKTETLKATVDNAGWNTTLRPSESSTANTIKFASFDDFISNQTVPADCKLMKIDAEGFDCRIIRGATKFIQQSRPILSFEYNRFNMDLIEERGLATILMLREMGYSQAVFHDCNGRFFTAAELSNEILVHDLLDYADGKLGLIFYFDLTVFHQDDADIANEFIKGERARRLNPA